MPQTKNTNLNEYLEYGDVQKIVSRSGVSYYTVRCWLKDEGYRNTISAELGTLITNAYEAVITEKAKMRQDNINRLARLQNESKALKA